MKMRKFAVVLVAIAAIYGTLKLTPGFVAKPHAVAALNWRNIAHRGGPGLAPEHTLLAYNTALQNGANALEIDVHSTSDNQLILMHDDDVDRTTNGSGPIRGFTLAQLQALDAGMGEQVPTLEQLFTAHPDVPYVIELKQSSPSIAQPVCDAIIKHHLSDRVIVGAFTTEPLAQFRAACPAVATGMSQNEVISFLVLQKIGLSHWHWVNAQAMQLPIKSAEITILTPSFVKAAQNKGLLVQAWTINETDQIKAMAALKVDGIISDYPNRVSALSQ